MNEGDVVLIALPQADGLFKNRAALLIRRLPPFNDWLLCGISSQVHQAVAGFDEIVRRTDSDFVASGLVAESVIRLGFLSVVPARSLLGSIGRIEIDRLRRLQLRLSDHLKP